MIGCVISKLVVKLLWRILPKLDIFVLPFYIFIHNLHKREENAPDSNQPKKQIKNDWSIMKITQRLNNRGIAMTEYLIILAIVAVAAILVVSVFGKQIKSAFTANTAAMGGNNTTKNSSLANTSNNKGDNMSSFTTGAGTH